MKRTWHDVIDLESSTKGIATTRKASVPPAATSKKPPRDHAARVLELAHEGHTAVAIRNIMRRAGFFRHKNSRQILGFIMDLVNREIPKKPVGREAAALPAQKKYDVML